MKKEKSMAEVVTRTPITAELRSLRPGDKAVFPIEKYGSVNAIIHRLRRELAREHWEVRAHEIESKFQYVVTRVR